MTTYNQKFWANEYSHKNNIIKWFENYKTYLPEYPNIKDIEQVKKDFLKGEEREIQTVINNKSKQEQIYKFVESVINEYLGGIDNE